MFWYFLQEYKKTIYKGNLRNLKSIPLSEWICFLLSMSSVIVDTIGALLWWYMYIDGIIIVVSTVVGVVATIALDVLRDYHLGRNINKYLDEYKRGKLYPLEELLKSEKYDFYSAEKVNWLLASCEEKLKGSKNPFTGISDSFFRWVLPVITLLIGAKAEAITEEIAIQIALLVLLLWCIFFILKVCISPLIEYLACPNKGVLLFLKTELQYVRSNLK